MSAMSQLSAEREADLEAKRSIYLDAFEALMDYQDKHDINHRTLAETEEVARLNSICMIAQMHYENAKMARWRVLA